MTELIDLEENPKEKITTLYKKFVKDLEEDYIRQEQYLDKHFIEYRKKVATAHYNLLNHYKHIYDEMLLELEREKEPVIIQMFEEYIRGDIYQKRTIQAIFKKLLPAFQDVRKNEGSLDIEVKTYGENATSSRSGGFGMMDIYDFWHFEEGSDPERWKFTVEKRTKTWEDIEKEREEKNKPRETLWPVIQRNRNEGKSPEPDLVTRTLEELGEPSVNTMN